MAANSESYLVTPFHSMGLVSPAMEPSDVDPYTALFGEAIDNLFP